MKNFLSGRKKQIADESIIGHMLLQKSPLTPLFQIPPNAGLPLAKGRCEKIEIIPLTLPSPSRGEGKLTEMRKEFPSPLRGEGLGGGDHEIFSHLQGGKGGLYMRGLNN